MQLPLKSVSFANEVYFLYLHQENVPIGQAPGVGYTPELMEFHLLNEIDNKLQLLFSDGEFPTLSSSSSKCPSQIYQVGYRSVLFYLIFYLKCLLRSILHMAVFVSFAFFFRILYLFINSMC